MISESVIDVSGLQNHYLIAGIRSNPVLVFLHAWGVQEEWLRPVVLELSKAFYVIAPEHPGLIKSQTPTDYSFESYALNLRALLESLDITESVTLVGSSFGGGIATSFALTFPEKVKSLFLVDSVLSNKFPQTLFMKVYHFIYRNLITHSFGLLKKYFLKQYLGTPMSFLSKEETKRKIEMLKYRPSLSVDYRILNLPVFLVWGKQDKWIHPISYAREILSLLPQGHLIEYNGSVSTIYRNPERICSLIREYSSSTDVDICGKKIWDYMLLHQPLEKADALFVLGSTDTRVAEYAARLYKDGWAPIIIFSGRDGKGDMMKKWGMTEAEKFASIAQENGVPAEAMLLEKESTNTGENILFTQRLLQEKGIHPKKLILVQKPYMERRVYAAFSKQWLGMEFAVASPHISYEEYPDATRTKDHVLNMLVGDLQRIKEYPAQGFQIEQEIPDDVWHAWERLVALGYTKHLIV